MADTELAPDVEQEPADAPEEGDPNVNDADPVEVLAREMGWSPKDQYRGPEADWKPAKDFILAGRDIQKGLSRDLRSVRTELSQLAATTGQFVEDKIKERDAYWQNVHRQAVKDGDEELAERAVTERVKLTTSPKPQPSNNLPPETVEWQQRNSWMGQDPLATARAKEIAERLAKDGYDVPTQLREVERAIKKEFPEHFPAPAKQPATVTTATTRSATTGSREKGFADMPAESQKAALDMERRLGVKKEDFAARYWANQRKVG